MDIQPPATLANEDRIQLLGTFAAPSREQAYRAKFRRDDLWLARVCMLAAMARVLLFGIVDYHPLAATGFWFPLGCRAAFVLVSFWVLVSLRSVGRLFFAWCMLLAAATICFIFLKMPGDTRFVYMTLASVGLAYAVAPLPLLWQMLVAIPFSIAGFGILLARTGVPPFPWARRFSWSMPLGLSFPDTRIIAGARGSSAVFARLGYASSWSRPWPRSRLCAAIFPSAPGARKFATRTMLGNRSSRMSHSGPTAISRTACARFAPASSSAIPRQNTDVAIPTVGEIPCQ